MSAKFRVPHKQSKSKNSSPGNGAVSGNNGEKRRTSRSSFDIKIGWKLTRAPLATLARRATFSINP